MMGNGAVPKVGSKYAKVLLLHYVKYDIEKNPEMPWQLEGEIYSQEKSEIC